MPPLDRLRYATISDTNLEMHYLKNNWNLKIKQIKTFIELFSFAGCIFGQKLTEG